MAQQFNSSCEWIFILRTGTIRPHPQYMKSTTATVGLWRVGIFLPMVFPWRNQIDIVFVYDSLSSYKWQFDFIVHKGNEFLIFFFRLWSPEICSPPGLSAKEVD